MGPEVAILSDKVVRVVPIPQSLECSKVVTPKVRAIVVLKMRFAVNSVQSKDELGARGNMASRARVQCIIAYSLQLLWSQLLTPAEQQYHLNPLETR